MPASGKKIAFTPPDFGSLQRTARLSQAEFEALAQLISTLAGIHMSPHKATLIESRLYSRLRALQLESFSDYIGLLQRDAHEREEFINALTTHKTEFFREPFHFEFLAQTIVPALLQKAARGTVNVWCAAASTGEEPYTLAMVLSEALRQNPAWDFRILATDIDTSVLKKAEQGVYKEELLEVLRPELLYRYFLRGTGPNQGYYRAVDSLKARMKFRRFNLIADQLISDIRFDVIFLRNVLIYFQADSVQTVIEKLSKRLKPGGYLIVGHSETLNRISHELEPLQAAIYRKK